jgi:hypothetical protein
MVRISLEPAKNGIIKRTADDNHGGAKEHWTTTEVYESSDTDVFGYIMKFFFDLCEDLGVNLGSKFDKEVITITKEWGSHYEPSNEEINSKIKELEANILLLKECLKP